MTLPRPLPPLRLSANWPLVEVLTVDESLLAINKPAGLLIAPDRWDKRRENLMGLLHSGIAAQRPWARAMGLDYLANVHRLDAGTSGIVLMARSKPDLVTLARQFRDRHPRKVYHALILGRLPQPEVTLDLPLGPSAARPGLAVVDRNHGKPALTRFREQEVFKHYSLIEAEPLTGRQHQIRVHLHALGCPLVADPDYGDGQPLLLSRLKKGYKMKAEGERPLMGRPALHAASLEIVHPATQASVTIEAPDPKDFAVALKYLRKFG